MSNFDLTTIKKILIVKMSSIGDVIHALPTLAVLRKNFPQAHITWVVEPKAYDVVRGHPDIDEVILLDLNIIGKKLAKPATFSQGLAEISKLAKRMRQGNYDLVLDLQGLLKSGLISYFTKAPIRLVYCINREGSGLLATHRVPANPESRHVIQKCLDTARYLGLQIEEEDTHQFKIAILPEDEEFAHDFLASQGVSEGDVLVGLNPGAAWPTKQWPPEKFARLADLLIEKHDCKVLIFGGPGDRPMFEAIVSQMKQQPIVAGGKTSLKQLGALIKKCKVFVGSDTGPMHIAVAVKTPVVAIFGPTDPHYSGPRNPQDLVVSKSLPCSPCFKVKKCPQGQGIPCIEAIEPEDVLEAIERLL